MNEPREYMSTTEARKRANCSNHFIIYALTHDLLEGFKALQGPRRLVWKIYRDSFESFLSNYVAKSNRVGPLGPRYIKRNPCISRGYRQIYNPSHHRSDCNGYVPEHILVMEKHLKRKILKPEQVHHIDGDRLNNKPSNLKVYASMSEHLKKGHSDQYRMRLILRRLFANPKEKLLKLSPEKKAEYFDMLVSTEPISSEK